MIVDHDCMEVTAAIVSQLRNVLPSAPKEYVCLSVCLSFYHGDFFAKFNVHQQY